MLEAVEVRLGMLRPPEAFQQQMIEAERGIERGIAIPGALGIEEDRPARADEDIFRADVAVDKSPLGRFRYVQDSAQAIGEIAMSTAGRNKIGLEADGIECIVGAQRARRRMLRRGSLPIAPPRLPRFPRKQSRP